MMRCLFGVLCVCALALTPLVGCSETAGDGGSGGSAGTGGIGGSAGIGGMPECESAEDCDDGNECTANGCADGMCEFTSVQDGTTCGDGAGTCEAGSCVGTFACTERGIRDAIAVGGGPHTFDCDGPQTVTAEETIIIDNDVSLDGEGSLTVDVDDGSRVHPIPYRVFSVLEGVTAKLDRFTVTGSGETDYPIAGLGGILNRGVLTLANSTVSGNTASGDGGGISNSGTLTVTSSTVSGNIATCRGGGISNTGTLTLTNSTVSGNTGSCNGSSGIYHPGGTLMITNSTITGNDPLDVLLMGGEAMATIVSSTVSYMGNQDGELTLTNTLVDGDCKGGATTSDGYNIESPGDTCGFDQPTDQVNVSAEDLKLGELADNGGATETHALLPGSVAIDKIPADMCEVETDQRGAMRPQSDACDIGAFETEVAP